MQVSYNCPNEDCEEELEAEVDGHHGSPQTYYDPGEAPETWVESMDKFCPKCGYGLEADKKLEEYICKKAEREAVESRVEHMIDRYNDRNDYVG